MSAMLKSAFHKSVMCTCVYVCTCVYTDVCVYMHLCICVSVHVYVCVCVCVVSFTRQGSYLPYLSDTISCSKITYSFQEKKCWHSEKLPHQDLIQ